MKLQEQWWGKGDYKVGGAVVQAADRKSYGQQMAAEKAKYAQEIRNVKEQENQLRMEAL